VLGFVEWLVGRCFVIVHEGVGYVVFVSGGIVFGSWFVCLRLG